MSHTNLCRSKMEELGIRCTCHAGEDWPTPSVSLDDLLDATPPAEHPQHRAAAPRTGSLEWWMDVGTFVCYSGIIVFAIVLLGTWFEVW